MFKERQSQLLQEAATLGKVFSENEDTTRYAKLNLFGEKLMDEEYMIGFAGHFSAGKSSMINALTGVDLLPSSPIPTSANIVKVSKSDEDYAVIHLTDGQAVKYGGHGFSDAVKSFSKDGAAVSLIEIGHKESALPLGITVMDTPGVDSTDDAHRLSTESALHLADLVFYTMDYNHVQSEMNFSFTKELMRYNPNVYLIINQIDKHRDSELPFEQFKSAVESSFKMWGVNPRGIFYTSLLDFEHPHNDFNEVKSIVKGSIENWQENFIQNAHKTIEKLNDEHQLFLSEEIAACKDNYSTMVADEEWEQEADITEELRAAKKQQALLTEDTFSISFDRERNILLENAAITPYETREALKNYLESVSSRFKVGLIFSAKKTAEERERRKELFAGNLKKLVHTQIEVHLKTLMKKSLKEAGILSDERSLEVDAMNLEIPFKDIEKEFEASDVITGDTILNYSNQMKTTIIIAFKRLTDDWKLTMSTLASNTGTENAAPLELKVQTLDKKLNAIQEVNELRKRIDKASEIIDKPSLVQLEEVEKIIESWRKKVIIDISEYVVEAPVVNNDTQLDLEVVIQDETNKQNASAVEIVREKAIQVASVIKTVPGFSEAADYLQKKAERLNGQEFSVALFGAFSAGKSSFSNALIGENILPVSPNPTTATINRIRPVTPERHHKTADVMLKTVSRMTEDVVRSFEALGVRIATLDEAYEQVEKALGANFEDENLHIHKAFITAFKKGYPNYAELLGTILRVEREEFVKFVAEEDRSCFVESIDFYYDCDLTRKGITLVDTPGADSINARHTDVAFDYIRNADAILFVTYYNHAFAKADREFLIQLGRVKDAFELDKMFFIVNAIDLATNDEESSEVKTFVSNELQKFGIRNPRVHGISSLQALGAKTEGRQDPHMERFEESFHQFLEHDLHGLAVQSLEEETIKTTERLASLISRTASNMQRKSERLLELKDLENSVQKRYANSFAGVLKTTASNELGELIYYILQRVFLRFSDFYREAYNPASFMNKPNDQALKTALDETVNSIGFDLTQELKVTNLRMLNFLNKSINDRQKLEMYALKEMDETLVLSLFEPQEGDMLSFKMPFNDSTVYSSVNKVFKNERSFFEKGDREVLRDRLHEVLKKDSEAYLAEMKTDLDNWLNNWIDCEAEALREHLLTECLTQIATERTLLEGTEKIEAWREIYEKLQVKELV